MLKALRSFRPVKSLAALAMGYLNVPRVPNVLYSSDAVRVAYSVELPFKGAAAASATDMTTVCAGKGCCASNLDAQVDLHTIAISST
jgi:hypothetical protein